MAVGSLPVCQSPDALCVRERLVLRRRICGSRGADGASWLARRLPFQVTTMTTRLRNKSILVVEDDAAMLRALERVIQSESATVTSASDVPQAVDILTRRQRRFDLVLTDLRMPLVTGLTLVYAIREVFPKVPVVVLTAFGSPEVKAECLRQGAAGFLEKPLDAEQLVAALETALGMIKSR